MQIGDTYCQFPVITKKFGILHKLDTFLVFVLAIFPNLVYDDTAALERAFYFPYFCDKNLEGRKESEKNMRIPELDFDMDIEGLVAVSKDGDIELLPCHLTRLITAETHLIFDAFYICLRGDTSGAILCAYRAFSDVCYVTYDVLFSELEIRLLSAL